MSSPAAEGLLTRAELAELWSVHENTIDEMRHHGMPYLRWGARIVRFEYSACAAWLKEQQSRGDDGGD